MKHFPTLVLILLFFQLSAQETRLRISFPDKVPTPWTHLELNNDPRNFQFAVVTDRTGGHRPGVFMDAVQKINLLQPEFVMSVGDLIEGYTTDTAELIRQWEEFDGFVNQLQMPFFYVPGNHDITNQVMEDLWKERLGPTYYSFVYGEVLFLCLNSEDQRQGAGRGTISDTQFEWIKKELAEHADVRWTLLFLHQPLWHQEDTERWREVEALLSTRPHTVYAGHEHSYVREKRNNGRYYTLATTGGGSSLRGAELGEFDHVAWVTMTEQGPIMANLQLEGIWGEDVVTADTREYIRKALRSRAIRIDPIYVPLTGEMQDAWTTTIRVTNDEDVPMRVRFEEGFSWDLTGAVDEAELVVPPNSVEMVKLDLRKRKEEVEDPRPFKLRALLSWEREDMATLELPFTYYIRAEPKFVLDKRRGLQVDGDLSEWGLLRYEMPTANTPDCSARFDLAYDEDYLYIAAEVEDDSLQVTANTAPWVQDYIGLVVNAEPLAESAMDEGRSWFLESLYLLQTARTEDVPSNIHPEGRLPEDLKHLCVKTEKGYLTEVAVPLSYLTERQGKNWRSLRFNLLVGDLDGSRQESHWFQTNWRDQENRIGSGMFFRE